MRSEFPYRNSTKADIRLRYPRGYSAITVKNISSRRVLFHMNDLFIFNKAFTAEDVKRLAAYYGL